MKTLQCSLRQVVKWADAGGMKLSVQKSCGVIFTHCIKQTIKAPLMLGSTPLKMEKSIKFLGMVFDARLNWLSHCQYVEERCKNRLNFMRSITSTKWGAGKTCLIILYKALIRSLLDYGAIALGNASSQALRILDSIQARALRICCGAMRSTAVAALQVECGEPPLDIRRLRQQIVYGIKVCNTINNPASKVFEDSWTNYYGKNSASCTNIYLNTKEFFNTHRFNVEERHLIPPPDPPWQRKMPVIDLTLTKQFHKEDPPECQRTLSLN